MGLEPDAGKPQHPYKLLLLLAALSAGSVSGDDGSGAVHLERLVVKAAGKFWGANTHAVRFGHPPEPERPSGFEDAVRWLANKMNARPLPLAGSAFRRADGGVDVVAWRTFADDGPGPIAVFQVTYESDLRAKSLEAAGNDLDRWVAIARPMPVLACPMDRGGDPDLFVEVSQRVLVLDRWRLLDYLNGEELLLDASDWADNAITQLAI
jgi:hypothetical protein